MNAPHPEPRSPLTRHRIATTAVSIADHDGLHTVTMRRVAEELGIEAMSLYHHVKNKDDLIAAMRDVIMHDIPLPPPNAPWKDGLRHLAGAARDVYLRHRWAIGLVGNPSNPSPARMRFGEALLRCLRENGFSAVAAHHAYHALEGHITGFTMWQASLPIRKSDIPALGSRFLASDVAAEYPYSVEHIRLHMEDPKYNEGDFEFGLELILDGLERLRDQPGGEPEPER